MSTGMIDIQTTDTLTGEAYSGSSGRYSSYKSVVPKDNGVNANLLIGVGAMVIVLFFLSRK